MPDAGDTVLVMRVVSYHRLTNHQSRVAVTWCGTVFWTQVDAVGTHVYEFINYSLVQYLECWAGVKTAGAV